MPNIQIFCPISGSNDLTVLQTYAASPEDHYGKIIYVAKVSGSVVVPPFVRLGKFYFNEVGTWHDDLFLLEPPTGAFDECGDC